MRGRDKFSTAKPMLDAAHWIISFFPEGVSRFGYRLFSNWDSLAGVGFRYIFARRLCKAIGRNVLIGPGVFFVNWDRLVIGDNVSIHRGCYIDALGGIRIGSDVSIAHQVSIISFEHSWANEDLPIRDNDLVERPVRIADDVWVGCAVRILAGSSIGARSVIAAGAVVKGVIRGGSIAGGVPAKVIGTTRSL